MIVEDQMGRKVRIDTTPKRMISIVPSQTELLFELGLEEEVLGITKFCIHPESWKKNKEKIGGTKKLWLEKIEELQPDLIIGNKEENTKSDIAYLENKFPVWMSDIYTPDDALQMILKIGRITNKYLKAQEIVSKINSQRPSTPKPKLKVAYFIWRDPWMVAANGTYIHHFLETNGFENVFGDLTRYPSIDIQDIKEKDLDYIFLSSEPFPFKEKHKTEFSNVMDTKNVKIVDGEMFSWYGSRMYEGYQYAQALYNKLSTKIA